MKRFFLKYLIFVNLLASFLVISCDQHGAKEHGELINDSLYLKNVPVQPVEDTWRFVEDLKTPIWSEHAWEPADPALQQADLSQGVTIKENFPDTNGRLETAYADLRFFLAAGSVSCDNGNYMIVAEKSTDLEGESFRIDIMKDACHIFAGDADGIRRGIYYIEDEMLCVRGPFLPLGTVEKNPIIQRRISRCFFGPIKRPPGMRDELMDDVDYYPDQYLNRLAHEGVNGLWLTIEFRDLVATSFTPEAGEEGEKRLAKLRQTVTKCLRYGIRTYIFCIEPRSWDTHSQVVSNYPELAGAPGGKGYYFCPMSQTAHKYLHESVNKIFSTVPELGGIINITHGERGTTCLSTVPAISDHKDKINCPRCSHKEPWEILHASLSAMEQGMHDAAPESELISWLYMPQPQRFVTGDSYALGNWVYDIPANTPEGVILQFNFESGVSRIAFDKLLVGGDYWISNPGPSNRFERIANVARKNGTKVSAKIQTGNSHEVATTPYVPVPSLLYKKFSGMRRLGVSHTMLCWYFGNYPGLMNKAAGILSMEPFPPDEETFLIQLASVDWKKEDISAVVRAWKHFSDGYQNYPLTNMFQYYGPMHDGPVWPLFLKPVDAPLSPTWQIGSSSTLKAWPPSGDRVGECIGEILTLEEAVELTSRISKFWDKGVELLKGIEPNYADEPERIRDIGVAKALGIQFRSGFNILHFYLLREKMFRMKGEDRFDLLNKLVDIIHEELELDEQLLSLCKNDSRLGFHSEAEGYKYFPEKIRWRMQQLRDVLIYDVPELKSSIQNDILLFPEYTGIEPVGTIAYALHAVGSIWSVPGFDISRDLHWQSCGYGANKSTIQWAGTYDMDALYIIVSDSVNSDPSKPKSTISDITVKIEPRRLWPCTRFVFKSGEEYQTDDNVRAVKESGKWFTIVRIPMNTFRWSKEKLHPVRVDVNVQMMDGEISSWCPNNPITPRLMFGTDNPADLGWLIFHD